MQIKNMSYIIALAECQTLSGAGKRLGISQPTLSVFLSDLEQELGMDLFIRDKKETASDTGRTYLSGCRQTDSGHPGAHASVHPAAWYRCSCRNPHWGYSAARFRNCFQDFLPLFFKVPACSSASDGWLHEPSEKMVLDGTCSFSLGTCFDTESPEFDYITLFREEVVIVVPSFHPTGASLHRHARGSHQKTTAGRTPGALRLSVYPHDPRHQHTKNIGLYFCSGGFTPTVVYESGNNTVIKNMVRGGSGIGFQPRSLARLNDPDIAYLSLSPRVFWTCASF